MLRSLAFILLFLVSQPSHGQSPQSKIAHRMNDYPFQCGAAFFIIAVAYREGGDTDKAERYTEKFERRVLEGEVEFGMRGRSKSEAATYMQEHIDMAGTVIEKDATVFVDFVRFCDKKFPN